MGKAFIRVFVAVALCVTLVAPVLAQEPDARAEPQLPQGLSSCFDYYRFGSTPVTISGSLSETSPGAKMGFSGTLQNDNPYSLQGVKVIAKLFKIREDGEKDAYGPDVLHTQTVAENFSLAIGETKPLSFEVAIPKHAEPGRYRVTTFVTSMDRFSLLGLPFTDDIIGGIFDFDVVGDSRGAVMFDKQSVTVNGAPYLFASFPPRIGTTTREVVVSATLENASQDATKGMLSWKLYSWSAERPEQLVNEQAVPVKLVSKQRTTVSYTITDVAHSVYYLVGELTTERGDRSIIGVRMVRESVREPRLAYVGVMPKENAAPEAFLCMHSAGTAAAEGGEVTLEITKDGKSLGEKYRTTYSGLIPGEMSALALPVAQLPTSFEVTATLSQNGKELDKVVTKHSCSDLGIVCDDSLWAQISPSDPQSAFWYIIGIVVLLCALVGTFMYYKKKTTPSPQTPTIPNITSL